MSFRQYRLRVAWIEAHPDGSTVTVWVVPGTSRTEIKGLHGDALRVRVAAPAEGGKANRALLALLGAETGAREVTLLSGAGSRRKTLLLRSISPQQAQILLGRSDA